MLDNFIMEAMPIDGISAMLTLFSVVDVFTLSVCVLLFLAASPICRWLQADNVATRAAIMRLLNFLIICAVLSKVLFFTENDALSKITQSLIIIYFALLSLQIINYFTRRRFGKKSSSKTDQVDYSDTYSSRGLSIFFTVLISLITIVTCLKVFELNSLLEAGGALGIVGLFLAMTQASWAPDIINGLIILNSQQCEEGDVIEFTMDGDVIVASIFKTKLFNTHCLDLANNHRIIIGNAKLRDFGIQNLSRFASAKGLRECLLFKIDYQHSQAEVEGLITRAFDLIDTSESVHEEQYKPEVRVQDTGDYAVTWAVYYYIKDIKKILSVRQLFRAYILAEAKRSNISLATPMLQLNSVNISKA